MNEVRIFAPATISNISCGFDIFGFAIDEPGDEIILRKKNNPGITISAITGDNGKLPFEPEKNTAGVAVRAFMQHIGNMQGIEIEIHKHMPLGSGMGSSAASAVAAVYGINILMGEPLSRTELLPFVMEAEKTACGSAHADNAAPSLLGGFILVRSYHPLDIVRIPVSVPLFCGLIHPEIEIKTKDAREMLPLEIPLKTAVAQWGNTAGLVAGLCTGDYDLIFRSVIDYVAEPVRKTLIPDFEKVRKEALKNGCEAFGISGSGPSLFMLARSQEKARTSAQACSRIFSDSGIESQIFVSSVNMKGASLL